MCVCVCVCAGGGVLLVEALLEEDNSVCVCVCVCVVCVCAGGGVLLVEALLEEDNSGPLTAQLYSLNMLVQTEGCERKASGYSRLLSSAGFTHIQIHNTGKIYDAILARK